MFSTDIPVSLSAAANFGTAFALNSKSAFFFSRSAITAAFSNASAEFFTSLANASISLLEYCFEARAPARASSATISNAVAVSIPAALSLLKALN